MNLLELMLKERVIFPAYAQYAVQDYTGRIRFADKKPVCNQKYYEWEGCWCLHSISGNDRLDNWHSDIVTRYQYRDAGGSMEVDDEDGVQLDNPEIEPGFEPFVSVEDAQEYKAERSITPSKYTKHIHGVSVDVYDVLMAWGVTNPALQHLIKKALQCGQRGHKDNQQDLQDIIDSAIRAKELECQKN